MSESMVFGLCTLCFVLCCCLFELSYPRASEQRTKYKEPSAKFKGRPNYQAASRSASFSRTSTTNKSRRPFFQK